MMRLIVMLIGGIILNSKITQIYLICVFVMLFNIFSPAQISDSTQFYHKVKEVDCKIKKIKKSICNTGYIIFAEEIKIKQKIVIISLKKNKIHNNIYKKITKNKIYRFILISYYTEEKNVNFIPYLLDEQWLYVNGEFILIDGMHYLREVYITPNLEGLYYIPNE